MLEVVEVLRENRSGKDGGNLAQAFCGCHFGASTKVFVKAMCSTYTRLGQALLPSSECRAAEPGLAMTERVYLSGSVVFPVISKFPDNQPLFKVFMVSGGWDWLHGKKSCHRVRSSPVFTLV